MNKGNLDFVRHHSFLPEDANRGHHTVIFDFEDDWHCGLSLKLGMTKTEVARILIEIGNLIINQTPATGRVAIEKE